MASWDTRSKVVVAMVLIVVYAAVTSASEDGDPVANFLTYLGFISVMVGVTVGAALLFRRAGPQGDRATRGHSRSQVVMMVAFGLWTVYAAIDASRANGGHVVAFIVEMFLGVLVIGVAALGVSLASRHRHRPVH